MVKIELTKETEHFPEGSVISVDENSARVLVGRKEAKLVEQTEPEAVESGGERARAINAAAKAKAESDAKTETGPETPDKATDSK